MLEMVREHFQLIHVLENKLPGQSKTSHYTNYEQKNKPEVASRGQIN